MATPNSNDNTQLGTGEQISNEAVAVTGVKRNPNLPTALQYKIPRSKIGVGPYGQDWGDASQAFPLSVESFRERQIAELMQVEAAAAAVQANYRYAGEGRMDTRTFDPYGRLIDMRGTR